VKESDGENENDEMASENEIRVKETDHAGALNPSPALNSMCLIIVQWSPALDLEWTDHRNKAYFK